MARKRSGKGGQGNSADERDTTVAVVTCPGVSWTDGLVWWGGGAREATWSVTSRELIRRGGGSSDGGSFGRDGAVRDGGLGDGVWYTQVDTNQHAPYRVGQLLEPVLGQAQKLELGQLPNLDGQMAELVLVEVELLEVAVGVGVGVGVLVEVELLGFWGFVFKSIT